MIDREVAPMLTTDHRVETVDIMMHATVKDQHVRLETKRSVHITTTGGNSGRQ